MAHAIQSALAKLSAAEWMPVTAVRVLIGVFFCISGGTKLFAPAQFSEMQQTMIQSHIPFPRASALLVSLVEFGCGGGLALGLLTPLCALMLMGDMIVAIFTNRIGAIHASGFLTWLDDFLYLPEVLYVLILLWLLFSGPGRYSVDGIMAGRAASPARPVNSLVERTAGPPRAQRLFGSRHRYRRVYLPGRPARPLSTCEERERKGDLPSATSQSAATIQNKGGIVTIRWILHPGN